MHRETPGKRLITKHRTSLIAASYDTLYEYVDECYFVGQPGSHVCPATAAAPAVSKAFVDYRGKFQLPRFETHSHRLLVPGVYVWLIFCRRSMTQLLLLLNPPPLPATVAMRLWPYLRTSLDHELICLSQITSTLTRYRTAYAPWGFFKMRHEQVLWPQICCALQHI